MTKLRVESFGSVVEYLRFAEELGRGAREAAEKENPGLLPGEGRLWYRGVGRDDYELSPGLYRGARPGQEVTELVGRESEMLAVFTARSYPYQDLRPASGWEFFFLMQHYGVPTRLLDWTENALIGLYFAVESAPDDPDRDAAVWILNPAAWNHTILEYMAPPGKVLGGKDQALTGYEPGVPIARLSDQPVAMYALHNSPRIVAQQGVFTVFGVKAEPMEQTYETHPFPDDTLVKVILPRGHLLDLRAGIDSIGLNETSVWPSLDGLAQELRRKFGF